MKSISNNGLCGMDDIIKSEDHTPPLVYLSSGGGCGLGAGHTHGRQSPDCQGPDPEGGADPDSLEKLINTIGRSGTLGLLRYDRMRKRYGERHCTL